MKINLLFISNTHIILFYFLLIFPFILGMAGLRTCSIVCCGSALIQIISIYAYSNIEGASLNRDPARLAAQAVSGIGFLGAGAIMRESSSSNIVHGLTTAASLWVCMAVGLAVGSGYFVGAAVGVLAILVALIGLKYIEQYLFTTVSVHQLRIHLFDRPHAFRELSKFIESRAAKIISFSLMRKFLSKTGNLVPNGSSNSLIDLVRTGSGTTVDLPQLERGLSTSPFRLELISVIMSIQCPEFGPNSFTNICHSLGELDIVYEIVAAHDSESGTSLPERLKYRPAKERSDETQLENPNNAFEKENLTRAPSVSANQNINQTTGSVDFTSTGPSPPVVSSQPPLDSSKIIRPGAVHPGDSSSETHPNLPHHPPPPAPARFFDRLRHKSDKEPSHSNSHEETITNPGELADELQSAVEASQVGTVFHGVINERLQIPVPVVTNVKTVDPNQLTEIMVKKGEEDETKGSNSPNDKKSKKKKSNQ